jgi:hypothetical protein
MFSTLSWAEPAFKSGPERGGPKYALDPRFNTTWWNRNVQFGPPEHQWRSYFSDGEEVARVLLSLRYESHLRSASTAILIWSFEVREDLRVSGKHLGTRIAEDISAEFSTREMYVGPTVESASFWERFSWPYCECVNCEGRDMIVRRTAKS